MSGKQIALVAIVLKGPRLTYEPVNDVTILDMMLVFATQTWNDFQALLGIPDIQMLSIQSNLHPLTDQTAIDRISIMNNPNRTALTNLYP